MRIINTHVDPRTPRFMTSFTFRAPLTQAEEVAGHVPLTCIKREKQITREGAAIYYHGGGVWEVSGYAYDTRDTLAAYRRAYEAAVVMLPFRSMIDGTPLIIAL